jgi:hypothetical protein
MDENCSREERLAAARQVLDECFWGDYHFTPEQVVSAAAGSDEWMNGLLFGKIIYNASHPTPLLLCLFGRQRVEELLDRETQRPVDGRKRTRILLVRANALGARVDLPQFSWVK